MSNYRSRRFLIDRIDERLGDVEKEKKFDLIMVAVGIAILLAGVLLISFCHTPGNWVVLFIFMIMAGLALTYVMTKEYFDDCKKAKLQNK